MPKRILLVDDDELVLKSVKSLFLKEGLDTHTAQSGEKALSCVAHTDFDLIVIDIRMPGIDGIETVEKIREIRKNQAKPEIPVVFITGYADLVPVARANALGEVVTKPFNLEEFLRVVKQKSGRRRVVITGLGVIAPNGSGKNAFWEANVNGISGVQPIEQFDVSQLKSKIAAQVNDFDPLAYMNRLTNKKTDRFTQFAIAAAKLAIEDSNVALSEEDRSRIGVSIGTGLGGMLYHEEVILRMYKNNFSNVDPLSVPKVTSNAASSNVAIIFSLTGPNVTLSTACSSGSHSIAYAYDLIQLNKADIMVAGGSEAPITPFTLCTFDNLRVLSHRNDEPAKASRPFDRNRDGFVMGEGSGVVVLEEMNHAISRNAPIYAEVIGYGLTSGAYHMVMPDKMGDDIVKTMELAIQEAGINTDQIDYINAHGTSTRANDLVETNAIKKVFGAGAYKIPISSTKSMIGHTLGASGAFGVLVCALSIKNGVIPPTINYEHKDPECDLDYVPNHPRNKKVKTALANSFGFGNNNVSLVIKEAGR